MTRLAIRAGMTPGAVADLDEDEFHALIEAVQERDREQSWGNLHEICATTATLLARIEARLEAGIPTVGVKQSKQVEKVEPYPRPQWLLDRQTKADNGDGDDVIVVHSVREALGILKVIPGGKGGG